MPDHVHFFCRAEIGDKRIEPAAVNARGYNAVATRIFDHVVRSNESYAEKWNYVQENPVRAGLVKSADD